MNTRPAGHALVEALIAQGVHTAFGVETWVTGVVLVVLTGAVVLGGIKRIGAVAEWLVPFMCIGYIACVAIILFVRVDDEDMLVMQAGGWPVPLGIVLVRDRRSLRIGPAGIAAEAACR